MDDASRVKIDEVMDNFDFEKVHKAMLALGWRWVGVHGDLDMSDLRIHSRELLERAIKDRSYKTGSGGFYAGYTANSVWLSFEVASWESGF